MEDRFDYEFERVPIRKGVWTGKFEADYQNVIRQRGQAGWRFVQAFAPAVAGYGQAKYIDLIFEKSEQH